MHTHINNQSKIYYISICALFIVVALILSYLENLIPIPVPIPGIKLGFANIAILFLLYVSNGKTALLVNVIRIMLAGLLFTGFSAMLYALSGGIVSVVVMILMKKTNIFSIFGVSVGGAVTHVAAQLIVAAIVIKTSSIFMIMPYLIIAAVISGVIIALITYFLLRALPIKQL